MTASAVHQAEVSNSAILEIFRVHLAEVLADKSFESVGQSQHKHDRHSGGLNLLYSLSIGGNDLLSSSLYTAGICASYGGKVWLFELILIRLTLQSLYCTFESLFGDIYAFFLP